MLAAAAQDKRVVTISQVTGADGQPDLIVIIDMTRIESAGQLSMHFLRKLQVSESCSAIFWEARDHESS